MYALVAVVSFFAAAILVNRNRRKAKSDWLTEELCVALKKKRDKDLRELKEMEEALKREEEKQASESDANVVRGEWPQWRS